jgi:toxin ParE1/3/4
LEAGLSIGEHPLVGSRRPELTSASLRFLPLKRFPYLLAYDPDRNPPLIVRVLHAARDLPTALAD